MRPLNLEIIAQAKNNEVVGTYTGLKKYCVHYTSSIISSKYPFLGKLLVFFLLLLYITKQKNFHAQLMQWLFKK